MRPASVVYQNAVNNPQQVFTSSHAPMDRVSHATQSYGGNSSVITMGSQMNRQSEGIHHSVCQPPSNPYNLGQTLRISTSQYPNNNYEMAFIMPNSYTINSLPEPIDDKINIYEVPASIKAAIRYSGYTDNKKENKMKMLLIKELTKHNIDFDNDFEVCVYDAPYKFINRRNEIVVSVNMKSEKSLKSKINEIIYLGGGCFWCTALVEQINYSISKELVSTCYLLGNNFN